MLKTRSAFEIIKRKWLTESVPESKLAKGGNAKRL